MQTVMATLLLEWMKKEEGARKKEELARRAQNIREYLDKCKIIADEYGISVDVVLMAELKEELNTFSSEFCIFGKVFGKVGNTPGSQNKRRYLILFTADRVGGGFRRRPLTPPDMRFRIRRFS